MINGIRNMNMSVPHMAERNIGMIQLYKVWYW